jgi:methionine-rich copper-binding protein CopC
VELSTRQTGWSITILAVFALATIALLWPSPAWAHTRLESTEPAADDTVDEPFETVLLVFSQAVSDEFAEVAVTDPAGNRLDEDTPVIDGARVEQAVAALEEQGEYTVEWRVVANDGHPLEGSFTFDYEGDLTAAVELEEDPVPEPDTPVTEPDPSTVPDETTAPDETTEPDDSEDLAGDERARTADEEPETAAAPPAGGSGGGSLPLLVAALAILLTSGAAVYAVRTIRGWEPESTPQPG